jgi:CBS domain-containing protein
MVTVREVMSVEIVSVAPSATVAEAATVMGAHHVGSALVLEDGSAVGIFTERDILRALANDFDAAKDLVERWMSRNPVGVDAATGTREARELMLERGFRHLTVTDGDDLIGIVSLRDVSRD